MGPCWNRGSDSVSVISFHSFGGSTSAGAESWQRKPALGDQQTKRPAPASYGCVLQGFSGKQHVLALCLQPPLKTVFPCCWAAAFTRWGNRWYKGLRWQQSVLRGNGSSTLNWESCHSHGGHLAAICDITKRSFLKPCRSSPCPLKSTARKRSRGWTDRIGTRCIVTSRTKQLGCSLFIYLFVTTTSARSCRLVLLKGRWLLRLLVGLLVVKLIWDYLDPTSEWLGYLQRLKLGLYDILELDCCDSIDR